MTFASCLSDFIYAVTQTFTSEPTYIVTVAVQLHKLAMAFRTTVSSLSGKLHLKFSAVISCRTVAERAISPSFTVNMPPKSIVVGASLGGICDPQMTDEVRNLYNMQFADTKISEDHHYWKSHPLHQVTHTAAEIWEYCKDCGPEVLQHQANIEFLPAPSAELKNLVIKFVRTCREVHDQILRKFRKSPSSASIDMASRSRAMRQVMNQEEFAELTVNQVMHTFLLHTDEFLVPGEKLPAIVISLHRMGVRQRWSHQDNLGQWTRAQNRVNGRWGLPGDDKLRSDKVPEEDKLNVIDESHKFMMFADTLRVAIPLSMFGHASVFAVLSQMLDSVVGRTLLAMPMTSVMAMGVPLEMQEMQFSLPNKSEAKECGEYQLSHFNDFEERAKFWQTLAINKCHEQCAYRANMTVMNCLSSFRGGSCTWLAQQAVQQAVKRQRVEEKRVAQSGSTPAASSASAEAPVAEAAASGSGSGLDPTGKYDGDVANYSNSAAAAVANAASALAEAGAQAVPSEASAPATSATLPSIPESAPAAVPPVQSASGPTITPSAGAPMSHYQVGVPFHPRDIQIISLLTGQELAFVAVSQPVMATQRNSRN